MPQSWHFRSQHTDDLRELVKSLMLQLGVSQGTMAKVNCSYNYSYNYNYNDIDMIFISHCPLPYIMFFLFNTPTYLPSLSST